jgi:single-stranded-DNA-specific exonuclease
LGGHALAAGVTLREADRPRFAAAIAAAARERLDAASIERIVETDGSPDEVETLELAESFRTGVWGQGFPAPVFDDAFTVAEQRRVGGRHLRLRLARDARRQPVIDAIAFNQPAELPARIRAAYRLDVNEFQGTRALQLVIEHWEAC